MPYISEAPTIFIQRFYTGWVTLRSQLVTPIRAFGRRIIELYDALAAGNDLEVTPVLTLKRRPGYSFWNVTSNRDTVQYFYSWRTASNGIFPIIDTTNTIYLSQLGRVPTDILDKTTYASIGLQTPMFGVGNYLFFGNKILQKWDGGVNGGQGLTNWGITAASGASGNVVGPNNGSSVVIANSGLAWSNISNLNNPSGAFTVYTQTPTISGSQLLFDSAFGFSLTPTSTITGISIQFDVETTGVQAAYPLTMYPSLCSAENVFIGSNAPVLLNSSNNGVVQTYTIGGPNYLFGTSGISPSTVNLTTFGLSTWVYYSVAPASGNATISVRNARITVYGQLTSGVTPTPTGSGSFAAVNGWTYVQCYGNSFSGEVSNAGIPSANTGPFSNKDHVSLPVVASTDPQVNQIRVFRTTDSGGGSVFYELPNSPFPNTTGNIQDIANDIDLQVTSQAPTELQNTPPPVGLTNLEWFSGRLWGSVGNLLYASTGPDGIIGLQQSNWAPGNVYVLPTPITRLINGPNGMLVLTQDDSYIVQGTDISNYTINEFIKNMGCSNYNNVATDGANCYVFTNDRLMIQITSAGLNDLGVNGGNGIADQLHTVDPTQSYVTLYRYGLDNFLAICDPANNLIYTYNLNQACWNLPQMLAYGGLTGVTSTGVLEYPVGVFNFMINSRNAGVGYRVLGSYVDFISNLYTPNVVIGSVSFCDPGNLVKMDSVILELENAGTVPLVSFLPNDKGVDFSKAVGSQITGSFNNLTAGRNPIPDAPTYMAPSTTYRSYRYALSDAKQKMSLFMKHAQVQLQFAPENAANEILGFGFIGRQSGNAEASGQTPELQGR